MAKRRPDQNYNQAVKGLARLGYEQVYSNPFRTAFKPPEGRHSLLLVEKNGDMFFESTGWKTKKLPIGWELRDKILEAGK